MQYWLHNHALPTRGIFRQNSVSQTCPHRKVFKSMNCLSGGDEKSSGKLMNGRLAANISHPTSTLKKKKKVFLRIPFS